MIGRCIAKNNSNNVAPLYGRCDAENAVIVLALLHEQLQSISLVLAKERCEVYVENVVQLASVQDSMSRQVASKVDVGANDGSWLQIGIQ